jgi:uncharacterized membrane protein
MLVILSGLIHAIWNLFTKRSIHKVVFLWYCQWTAILLFLPAAIIEFWSWEVPPLPAYAWLLIVSSMAAHGIYMLLLAQAYTFSDLSQAYPIMRGTSPFLVPILAVLFLGEFLPFTGWAGVLFIVIGIWMASGLLAGQWQIHFSKGTLIAFAVGGMITSYTIVDKLALQYFPPVILNEATNIGNLLALSWIAVRSGALHQEWRVNWRTILLGGIMAPAGYILFLWALELQPVSQLAPMREIGTVFGTLLGIMLLREPQGKARITASILIIIGVILLAL